MEKFKLYSTLTCLYAIAILYLSITSDPTESLAPVVSEYLKYIIPLKDSKLDFIYNLSIGLYVNLDKFGHFLFYFGLGFLLYLTLSHSRNIFLKGHVYLFAVGIGLLYGALIEFIQGFLIWRSASALDLIANASGLITMQLLIIGLRAIFKRALAKVLFLIILSLSVLFLAWFAVEYLAIIGSGIASLGIYIILIAFAFVLIFDFIVIFSYKLLIPWYKGLEVKEGELIEVLNNLCEKARVKRPKLFLSKSLPANIFSCGWDSNRASIVVGERALNLLNREELRALFAHELYHIKSKHFFRSTVVAVIAGILTMLATVAFWIALLTGFGTEEDPAPQFIKFFALAFFAPPAAFLVQLFISNEEFEADRYAVNLINSNGSALKSALEKLDRFKGSVNPAHGHLFALNPLGNNIFNSLFELHPSLTQRLRRI